MDRLVVQDKSSERDFSVGAATCGERIGILSRLFGCWHRNLSRPFTYGGLSYRVCLDCGARKDYDIETLQTFGSFYHPAVPSGSDHNRSN